MTSHLHNPTVFRAASRALGLLVLLWACIPVCNPLPVHAQTYASPAFSLQSPYGSLSRTQKLLNTIAIKTVLFMGYTEHDAEAGTWTTAGLPGVDAARYFAKTMDDGIYRTFEIVASPHPEGGYELYAYGLEVYANGAQQANPDLSYIQSAIQQLAQEIQAKQQAPDMQQLQYQPYHLSYIQADRALAMLKTLGYTVVEFAQQQGESLTERIYSPIMSSQWRLPVIVKLIDAVKTSLMDPSPSGYAQQGYAQQGASDLGGTFLHQATTGEPQQRLLIVYNENDPESIESLLDLLRGKIDRPARQIVIEALVIEINTDRMKELGLSIGGSKNKFGLSFSEGAQGENQPFSFVFGHKNRSDQEISYGSNVYDKYGNPIFGNPLNAFGNFFSFRSILKALVETGDAEVLSSPSVLVLDGRQARIQVGQQIPVSKAVSTTAGFASGVEYLQIGIVLNLRPRISEDGSEITMQVETIVSAVNQASSIQKISEGTQVLLAPVIDNRQVQTFVRVADNTPFIIGGLISTEKQDRTVGIPILSHIPILGIPFRRTVDENIKKEVIVVLTPHVAPLEEKNFSYVIPKDSDIFNSFGNILFRNAYRIRDDDVFDLRFIYESEIFQSLLANIQMRTDGVPGMRNREPFASLLNGAVPGEDILVRRMLWEIVHKTGFSHHIDVDRIILFEDRPDAADSSGFRTAFLNRLLAARGVKKENTLVLTFDATFRGTAEHPFVQPKSRISYENLTGEDYIGRLMGGNRRLPDGSPDKWTVLLSDVNPSGVRGATCIEVLQGVLVLKRILALNQTLPLTVKEFRVGRQIIFPTEQDLQQRYHIMDRDAARFFYETIQYYPEFEREFNRQTRHVTQIMRASE